MKNKKAHELITREQQKVEILSDELTNLKWRMESYRSDLHSMTCDLNAIASVVRGEASLYALCERDIIEKVEGLDLSKYYGRSIAFYVSKNDLRTTTEEEWNAHDADINWLGDFDFGGGGAGTLIFSLAGRDIEPVVLPEYANYSKNEKG